ncbi:hypothetical protein [Rummeliibacillus pycnus]|uniref:hypothetical protein n=1 Tax=Rummeliibacillus pycnus TaxID=101070 RepID=UPI003D2D5503
MKQRSKKFKKGIVMSMVLACSLVFGTVGASAASSATSTSKTVKTASTTPVVSKKGVITLPKKFKTKTVMTELRPEAAKLIKIYGTSLGDGKTDNFKAYAQKHLVAKTSTNYMLGYGYSLDNYKYKVKGTRKANSKAKIASYSKAVKKVTTSQIKNEDSYVGTGFATFEFSFQPKNYSPMNRINVYLKFSQLQNGKYVLETISYF